ncbi:MAG: amidohydrolase family protein, partial [Burkholderiaceae bacterium]|nr:amidohydrolase family protein [Burkholderiaceae bacterium]
LAKQYRLILHAHSDSDAIERIFRQDPDALVLWAHSGFDRPQAVREMLRRHRNLYADLAYRSDMGTSARVDPDWLEAFREFPERFMVGTDTFTPERLHYIPVHAEYTRAWLSALPASLAEGIAWRNAQRLIEPVWQASQARVASADAPCAAIGRLGTGFERVESADVVLGYRMHPLPLQVGKPFALEAAACARDPSAVVVAVALDAVMPEHRHSMNYAPRITATGENRFTADGLVLHMPGRWQLVFDLRVGSRSERLTHDTMLR